MPQNQSITVNNGAATPAPVVFGPNRITADNTAEFVVNDAQPLGMQPSLQWQVRKPINGNGNAYYKVSGVLKVPKVASQIVNGVTSSVVTSTLVGRMEFSVPVGATLQERKDLRVICANLLLNATIAASADGAESFW